MATVCLSMRSKLKPLARNNVRSASSAVYVPDTAGAVRPAATRVKYATCSPLCEANSFNASSSEELRMSKW